MSLHNITDEDYASTFIEARFHSELNRAKDGVSQAREEAFRLLKAEPIPIVEEEDLQNMSYLVYMIMERVYIEFKTCKQNLLQMQGKCGESILEAATFRIEAAKQLDAEYILGKVVEEMFGKQDLAPMLNNMSLN